MNNYLIITCIVCLLILSFTSLNGNSGDDDNYPFA